MRDEEEVAPDTVPTRLIQWLMLTLFSSVAFGSIFDVTKNYKSTRDVETYVALTGSIITTFISAVFTVILFKKWKGTGTNVELGFIIVCFVLWSVILPWLSISDATYFLTNVGFVTNANIYYSTWGAFLDSILLLIAFLKQYHDLNLYYIIGQRGSRVSSWIILLLASIVVMGSSISIQNSPACNDEHDAFYFQKYTRFRNERSAEAYCRRSATGIGLGIAGTLVCLLILCELVYLGEHVEQLLESETLFAILTCLAYAVCVGYITGDLGPATTIGNLYYAVWIGFLAAVHIVLECLRETAAKKEKRRHGRG